MAANRRARVAAVRPTDAPEWPQFRRFGDDAEKTTKSPSHFDVVFRDSRFFLKLGFLSRLVFSFGYFGRSARMGFRSFALLLLVSGLARVTAEVRSSSHYSLVLRTFAAHTTCAHTHGVKTEPFSKASRMCVGIR